MYDDVTQVKPGKWTGRQYQFRLLSLSQGVVPVALLPLPCPHPMYICMYACMYVCMYVCVCVCVCVPPPLARGCLALWSSGAGRLEQPGLQAKGFWRSPVDILMCVNIDDYLHKGTNHSKSLYTCSSERARKTLAGQLSPSLWAAMEGALRTLEIKSRTGTSKKRGGERLSPTKSGTNAYRCTGY